MTRDGQRRHRSLIRQQFRQVDLIGQMSFGTLVDAAVFAAVFESGPWMGDAPAKIAAAYAQAERRAPIAGAIAERFGGQLHIGRRRFDASAVSDHLLAD